MQINRNQVSGGVFLIGLALLFITGFWWPGILFVIGVSSIARAVYEEEKHWTQASGGLWMIGLGLLFWLPGLFSFNFFALLLIGVGLFMIFGDEARHNGWSHWNWWCADNGEKPKRDGGKPHDDFADFREKPKREIV